MERGPWLRSCSLRRRSASANLPLGFCSGCFGGGSATDILGTGATRPEAMGLVNKRVSRWEESSRSSLRRVVVSTIASRGREGGALYLGAYLEFGLVECHGVRKAWALRSRAAASKLVRMCLSRLMVGQRLGARLKASRPW